MPQKRYVQKEGDVYVYSRTESNVWTVGHYEPNEDGPGARWRAESDHLTREGAMSRVHYLNGGQAEGRRVTWTADRTEHVGWLIEFLVITDGYNRNRPCALVKKDDGVVNLVWIDERREFKLLD